MVHRGDQDHRPGRRCSGQQRERFAGPAGGSGLEIINGVGHLIQYDAPVASAAAGLLAALIGSRPLDSTRGAGIIVFRSDPVRGLTTAASVWLTAAIGMACGGSLFVLAGVVTAAYFLVVFVGPLLHRLTHPVGSAELQVEYRDGQGLLRDIVEVMTRRQWRISRLRTGSHHTDPGYVAVFIAAEGGSDSGDLLDAVANVEGVRSVDWADEADNSS